MKRATTTFIIDFDGDDKIMINYLQNCAKEMTHKIRTEQYTKDLDILERYSPIITIG